MDWDGTAPHPGARYALFRLTEPQWNELKEMLDLPDESRSDFNVLSRRSTPPNVTRPSFGS